MRLFQDGAKFTVLVGFKEEDYKKAFLKGA